MTGSAQNFEITQVTHLTDPKLGLYNILEQVVKAISEEIFVCDSVGIFLPQADDSFRGFVGIPNNINGISIDQVVIYPKDDCFYREIIETKKHIYIPDTSKDDRPDGRMIAHLGIKSLLGLPICYEKEIFGLVSLFKCGKSMILSEKQIRAVDSYIKIAAMAIHNMKLLSQEQYQSMKNQEVLTSTLQEWEKAKENFFKVFKFNPVAMSIVSEDHKYIDVNESWLKIFGVNKEKVIGKSVQDSVVRDGDNTRWRFYQRYKNRKVTNEELVLPTSTGEERNVLYTNEIIEFDGKKCLLNLFNDVTALRQLEKEIRRYDSLNLIAQMAAGIAHEIRNPMTTVRGFLQLLREKEGLRGNLQYYDLMIEEIDRANGIITEFLSLSKVKECDLDSRSLNDILDTIYPLLMADAFASDVMIEYEKGNIPELPLDEKEIRQLIFNLVRNGIEAMSSGGKIRIETLDTKDEVVLIIEDFGAGIPVHIASKIGAPFYTTKDSGTGLGLSICHSIARRHDAVIDFENKEKGTKVLVRFKKPKTKDCAF